MTEHNVNFGDKPLFQATTCTSSKQHVSNTTVKQLKIKCQIHMCFFFFFIINSVLVNLLPDLCVWILF